jgi:hypothetical protein
MPPQVGLVEVVAYHKNVTRPANRREGRLLSRIGADLLFVVLVAGGIYISPALRHAFYTADGLRLQRDSYLSWARDVIHNPAASVAVFAAAALVMYGGLRLIRRFYG